MKRAKPAHALDDANFSHFADFTGKCPHSTATAFRAKVHCRRCFGRRRFQADRDKRYPSFNRKGGSSTKTQASNAKQTQSPKSTKRQTERPGDPVSGIGASVLELVWPLMLVAWDLAAAAFGALASQPLGLFGC